MLCHGGDVNVIPLHQPIEGYAPPPRFALGGAEERAIAEVIRYYRRNNADPGYQGEFEKRYCEQFCKMQGGGYADAVATGTAALYVAIAALELPKGSEVLVSPITDPGTLSAIILNGLTPKLIDSAPGEFNVGPEQVAARVNDKTSAVVVVHNFGRAAAIDLIMDRPECEGLKFVEDCSQAHGATLNDKLVGNFADIAAFSTMYRKASISGGSGGIVFTRNVNRHRRARAYADRGKPSWERDYDERNPGTFKFPALNLNSNEISCAIGLASLKRLPQTIERRLDFVGAITDLIKDKSAHCYPFGYKAGDSPFIYPVIVREELANAHNFALTVAEAGIGLNPHYKYLAADWGWLKPYLADKFDTPNARAMRDKSFFLYLNENYTEDDAQACINAIVAAEKTYAIGSVK